MKHLLAFSVDRAGENRRDASRKKKGIKFNIQSSKDLVLYLTYGQDSGGIRYMIEKLRNFRSSEIPLRSPLSYLRLIAYFVILYVLFNYSQHLVVWIICLVVLIATFVLPYPKIFNWKPCLIGFGLTGGMAFVLIKAGVVRLGILALILGLAVSGWFIPNPGLILLSLLALVSAFLVSFASPIDGTLPTDKIAYVQREYSANLETVSGNQNIDTLLLSPTIDADAEKIDEVYQTDVAEELTEIGWKVWEIIVDPQARSEFIASEVVSRSIDLLGMLGMFALERLIARIAARKSKKAKSLLSIKTDIEKLTGYLEKVTKSRKAEIVQGTGLSEEKVTALLGYLRSIGVIVHEKACFWRFRTKIDENL
jgi:hypothetical protein